MRQSCIAIAAADVDTPFDLSAGDQSGAAEPASAQAGGLDVGVGVELSGNCCAAFCFWHPDWTAETVPKGQIWIPGEVKLLLAELPPKGGQRLFALWEQIPRHQANPQRPRSPLERLRNLLIRLSQDWHTYRVFDQDKKVTWTNNATEQVIGRMKMRSRTVRGV